jgi:hypothetical protein
LRAAPVDFWKQHGIYVEHYGLITALVEGDRTFHVIDPGHDPRVARTIKAFCARRNKEPGCRLGAGWVDATSPLREIGVPGSF